MKVETIKIGKSAGGSFYYAINGGAERTCNPSKLEFIPSDSYKTLQILKEGVQLFNDVIEKASVGDTQLTPQNAKELLDGLNATMGGGVVDSKDKGSFLTTAELESAYPEPESGWYAGVGSPAMKYVVSGGAWTATTEEYQPGGGIDPNAFVSKTEYLQFQEEVKVFNDAIGEVNALKIKDLSLLNAYYNSISGPLTASNDFRTIERRVAFPVDLSSPVKIARHESLL